MKLKIQTITGVTHEIQVERKWTISEVKVCNFAVVFFFNNTNVKNINKHRIYCRVRVFFTIVFLFSLSTMTKFPYALVVPTNFKSTCK